MRHGGQLRIAFYPLAGLGEGRRRNGGRGRITRRHSPGISPSSAACPAGRLLLCYSGRTHIRPN